MLVFITVSKLVHQPWPPPPPPCIQPNPTRPDACVPSLPPSCIPSVIPLGCALRVQVGQVPAAAVDYGVEADAYTMSMDSAFWVWNLVMNGMG